MDRILSKIFDQERSCYGLSDTEVIGCIFGGPADGESPFKECHNIRVTGTKVELRYPFWHDDNLFMMGDALTETCRAALWYSENVTMKSCGVKGVKCLRECSFVSISNCIIESEEFAWMVNDLEIIDSSIDSVYPFMRVNNFRMSRMKMKGKYSFQYCNDGLLDDCELNTKDAFWHSNNVTIRNCRIKGEYIGWYSSNLHLINCVIESVQPFCYCKGLVLENCVMEGCDLCFERSEVNATIVGGITSIKNPLKGKIEVGYVDEIILDGYVDSKAEIIENEKTEK